MQFDEEVWQLGRVWPNEWRAPVFKEDDLPATGLFAAFVKLSQEPAEVIVAGSSAVRLTQQPAEVVTTNASNVRNTQLAVEVIVARNPAIDEFYWLNWVAPVQDKLYQRLPIGDPEEIPGIFIAPPTPHPTEDYWQNPVLPIAASMYRSPIYLDPDEIPAGSLFTPFAKLSQMPVEIIVGYRYNPYVGWQGTSMSVS
jgi:hypothetical protein